MTRDTTASGIIRTLIYALLLVLPVALTTLTANATEIKTTVFSVTILMAAAVCLLSAQKDGEIGYRRTTLDLPVMAFLMWSMLVSIVMPYRHATAPYAIRLLGYVAAFFAVTQYITSRKHQCTMVSVMLAAVAAPCIYGLFQHFRIDPIAWTPSSHERILGTFGNPTYFAAYLAIMMPLTLSAYLAAEKALSRYSYLVLICVELVCLLWTYSRGPWIGTLLAVGIAVGIPMVLGGRAMVRRYWLPLIILLCLLCVTTAVVARYSAVTERAASATKISDPANAQRVLQWRAGLRVFRQHPILGVGPGALRAYIGGELTPAFFRTGIETVSEHAHNEFIEIAAEGGVIGLGLFVWILVEAAKLPLRAARSSRDRDPWPVLQSSALLGGIVGLLVCNLVGVTMRYSCGAPYFWMFLGLLASTASGRPGQEPAPAWYPVTAMGISRTRFVRLLGIAAVVAVWFAVRPFVASVYEKQADMALSDGQVAQCESMIYKCLRLSPYNTSVLYKLGSIQNATGRFRDSLKTYQWLESITPNYGRLQYNIGTVYTNLGDPRSAVRYFERAVVVDGLPESWKSLSTTYHALGDASKSAWALGRSLEGESAQGWRQKLRLAEQYARVDRLQDARKLLQDVIRDNPDQVKARTELAKVYGKLGRMDAAAEQYRCVLRTDPKNSKLRINLGCAYYEMGRYEDARSQFELAAKRTGGLELNADLGLVYWRLGEHKRAVDMCNAVVKENPDCPAADQARAIIFRITGKKLL